MAKYVSRNAMLFGVITLLAAVAVAGATPVIDGRYDPAEGYSMFSEVSFTVEKTNLVPQDGKLWMHQAPAPDRVLKVIVLLSAVAEV